MEEKLKIESYYQNEAKRLVDMLFDTKVFNEKTTRDSMQALEDLIAFYLQSYSKTANKLSAFQYKWKDKLKTEEND